MLTHSTFYSRTEPQRVKYDLIKTIPDLQDFSNSIHHKVTENFVISEMEIALVKRFFEFCFIENDQQSEIV